MRRKTDTNVNLDNNTSTVCNIDWYKNIKFHQLFIINSLIKYEDINLSFADEMRDIILISQLTIHKRIPTRRFASHLSKL